MSHILIVDDEESICRALAGILADEGFRTEAASDGDQALARLTDAARPDLVYLLRGARPELEIRRTEGATS